MLLLQIVMLVVRIVLAAMGIVSAWQILARLWIPEEDAKAGRISWYLNIGCLMLAGGYFVSGTVGDLVVILGAVALGVGLLLHRSHRRELRAERLQRTNPLS